jgi:hypothetical protein
MPLSIAGKNSQSQDMETRVHLHQLDKKDVIYTSMRYSALKKEISTIYDNMDEPGRHFAK